MAEAGLKDTTAYKIVRQITDHIYGPDEKLSSKDFVQLYSMYRSAGGSWEKLMDGDIGCVKIIEDVLDEFMQNRQMAKVASRVAATIYNK